MDNTPVESVITIKDLVKVYVQKRLFSAKKISALENVNFSVHKNEIFALIGLNGAGKTTLIKILLGLIRKTSGHADMLSFPVPDPGIMKRVGYLPEIPYFLGYLTPYEMLDIYSDFFSIPRRQRNSMICGLLEMAGLENVKYLKMKNFSKGMLQRVGFASCILNDPDLLLLDEPTTGLDPLGIITMREFMQKMHRSGKTIFFSSHLIAEVEKIATRVAILHNGTVAGVFDRKDFAGHLEDIFMATVKNTRIQELK